MQAYAPLPGQVNVLPDRRLRDRLQTMLDSFSDQPHRSIPHATGNRNDMDGAYNFFKNRRVQPGGVVTSCLPYTLANLQGCSRVLAVQDTSEANFSGLEQTSGLGHTDGPGGRGLKFHSCLAITACGVPAGLLTQQVWARDEQTKGQAKRRRHRAAFDKESYRWQDHARAARQAVPAEVTVVHVADREGDIYDWFAAPRPANTHLLVRVAQARRIVVSSSAGVQGHLAEVVGAQAVLGQHTLTIPRGDGRPERDATLTLRVAAVELQPPANAKQRSRLKPVPVWVLEAREESPPAGVEAVWWRLVSTERIETWAEALRALGEYILRWLIERYHFVLKSGCGVEELELSDADRLANALAVYSQVAVRVLRLTHLARRQPEAPASVEFSAEELAVLTGYRDGQRRPGSGGSAGPLRSLAEAVAVLGRLGGHLGRKGDGPPGVKVLWRGLEALHDLVLGFRIAQTLSQKTYP